MKELDFTTDVSFNVNFDVSGGSFDGAIKESSQNFNPEFSENETEIEDPTFGDGGVGSLLKHELLLGRDNPDQHSIGAITGLETELEDRPSRALTNLELEALLK